MGVERIVLLGYVCLSGRSVFLHRYIGLDEGRMLMLIYVFVQAEEGYWCVDICAGCVLLYLYISRLVVVNTGD